MRAVATRLPVDEAIGLIENGGELFADAGDALGGVIDRIEGILPGP